MTRPLQSTAIDEVVQLLAEHGFDGLADAVTVVLNEAMKIERTRALGAQPYERTPARRSPPYSTPDSVQRSGSTSKIWRMERTLLPRGSHLRFDLFQ
ncbi:MAG: hypothetical protein KF847_20200 [Pirellulales bacterium]|nr:hypothetical protein [Pirellulales bacterium]